MNAATAPAKLAVSDNAQQQILCKTQATPFLASFPLSDLLVCEFPSKTLERQSTEHFSSCSIFVTKSDGSPTEQWTEVEFRPSMARALRVVVARKVRPIWPYKETHPEYVLVAVTEELDCGHELDVYPKIDPLIAKRRNCEKCSSLPHLPLKKPAKGVA